MEQWGQGTSIYASGGIYVGEWKEGEKSGHGEYTYPDGAKYVGEFKEDNSWGLGTLTHPNGNVYSGEWENGEPVKGKFTRNGQPWHGSGEDAENGL